MESHSGKSGDVRGSRSLSPDCRSTERALPQPRHSQYRETNSSRLRQELKGMTVTSRVQSPRARSTTSSPSKIPQPIMPRLPSIGPCSPSRLRPEHVGSIAAPPAANVLEPCEICPPTHTNQDRDKFLKKFRTPPLTLSHQDRDKSPNKSQGSVDSLSTRRTVSNISNLSRRSERSKVTREHSTSHVFIDTRSKTLSSVSRRPTGEDVMNIMANKGRSPAKPQCESGGSGYGKPLVTSFNKRLTIMRNNQLLKQYVETNQLSPARSPVRSVRINITSIETAVVVQMHLIFWRVVHLSFHVWPRGWLLLYTIIAVGVLFWTANNASENKVRGSLGNANVKPDVKSATEKTSLPSRPPRSTSLTRYEKSLTRQTRSMGYREESLNMDRLSFKDTKPGRKPFAPLPDMVVDRLKQSLCKKYIAPSSSVGKPTSGIYSNKSYKPQLEDIKSSYLLLNKHSHDKIKDKGKRKRIHSPPPKKPKPLDDEQRQHHLKEVKQKYQSKGFFNDSRYDKIEGLNWIPWR